MEQHSNQAVKKGFILLLGVIVGLISGIILAFVLINKFNFSQNHKNEEKDEVAEERTAPDTVYKYVVHRYENEDNSKKSHANADTLAIDSISTADLSIDYTLESEDEPESEKTNVSEAKMVEKIDCPVLCLDNDKKIIETPENVFHSIEIQIWTTPIKNKISYNFNNKTLKLKGLTHYDHLKIFHFKENYYLQNGKHTYKLNISPNYSRLSEVFDISIN